VESLSQGDCIGPLGVQGVLVSGKLGIVFPLYCMSHCTVRLVGKGSREFFCAEAHDASQEKKATTALHCTVHVLYCTALFHT